MERQPGHARETSQSSTVRSYDVGDILRLLQLQRQGVELVAEIQEHRHALDGKLTDQGGIIACNLRWSEEHERLRVLRAERDAVRDGNKLKRRELQQSHEAFHRRKARLEIARRLAITNQKTYDDLRNKITQLSKVRSTIEGNVYARRVTLLRQLERIYPIELLDGAQLLFTIADIPLSNRDGHDDAAAHNREKRAQIVKVEQDDDTVSSALGMIGQMVALISAYTDTPLHYPIATAGSRSVIQDAISVMSGPRAFPLFSKGVERYRFEYAHFLLNKDIEQLMNHAGITILDIRNTLPNLKNLIVTLTASSQPNSKLSRRHHVGAETISLLTTHRDEANGATKHASLGLGRPLSSSDAHQQEIGYGTVVAEEDAQHAGRDGRGSGTSRWGMSLLGWGGSSEIKSAGRPSEGVSIAVQPTSTVPTLRTLGRVTK